MQLASDFSTMEFYPLVTRPQYAVAIRNGDPEAMRKLLAEESSMNLLQKDTAEQNSLELMPTVAMSLCMLASMEGGLPEEMGREICDRFSYSFQKCASTEALAVTLVDLLVEFSEAVFFNRLVQSSASLVQKCDAYIALHAEQKIYMAELASYCGYSVSGMEHAYKKETGHALSETIRKARLERARRLLETTDLSSAAIGRRLCFSTQSYFITLFKKEYGLTPKEYRDKLN